MATKQEIDAIYQETLGRAPDPGAYETYGGDMSAEAVKSEVLDSPEYEAKQAGVDFNTQVLEDGTVINIYGTKDAPGFDAENPFAFSNKEGDVFAVPTGTPVAQTKNYKLVKTANGLDYYVNEGSGGEGVFGTLADVTGIGEIKDIGDAASKAIPNELKSGAILIPGIADPFGITQGFWGKEYADEGRSAASDITGLNEGEIDTLQGIGTDITAGVLAFTGAPYVAAGMRSMKSASKVGEGEKETADLIQDTALNFAIAGALDLTAKILAPAPTPAPDAASGPDVIDPFGSTLPADNISIVDGASPSTPGVTFFENAPLELAPSSLTTPALPALGAGGAGGSAAPASAAPSVPGSSGGADWTWKEWATVGGLGISAAGLGLQAYASLTDDSGDQLDDAKELEQQKFEHEKELMEMQIAAEKEMQDAALEPLPSKAAPSTYKSGTVKSGKPYGVK